MIEPNETDLLKLWKSALTGDRSSLSSLLIALQDPIFRFCSARLGNQDQAIEATQEVAVRIIRNLSQFQQRSQVTTWAIGIALNVCRELERENKKWNQQQTDSLECELIDHDLERVVQNRESMSRIRELIGKLPARQQEAVVLRYFEELSIKQVAELMQVSSGTVKATLSQAVSKLKASYEPIRE